MSTVLLSIPLWFKQLYYYSLSLLLHPVIKKEIGVFIIIEPVLIKEFSVAHVEDKLLIQRATILGIIIFYKIPTFFCST